jgi:hypothetical protein
MDDKSHFRAVAGYRGMARIATALGDMILAWSRAELAQINCMGAMLGVDEDKACKLYSRLPTFRQRSLALLALIELYPRFEAVKKPLLKLNGLSKTRNDLVHGFYVKDGFGDVRVVDLKAPLDHDERSKPVVAFDVHQHAYTVRVWTKKLNESVFEIVGTDESPALDLGGPDLSPPRNTPKRSGRRAAKAKR